MCIVYCITNQLNGKRYIGWTAKTLEERWQMHVKNAIVRKRRFLLSAAIRKHGAGDETWHREVLLNVTDVEQAKQHECRLIKELNTCSLIGGVGYNMTVGGDGGTLSGEANPFYGKHHTANTIEKIRASIGDKLTGENNPQFGKRGALSPNWGRQHSEESRQKRSAKLKGKPQPKLRKPKSEETRRRMSEAQKLRRQKEKSDRENSHQ
jgi:group I intron endonuclease